MIDTRGRQPIAVALGEVGEVVVAHWRAVLLSVLGGVEVLMAATAAPASRPMPVLSPLTDATYRARAAAWRSC